jgi:membrane protein implicated in regulation of membrane protease activity
MNAQPRSIEQAWGWLKRANQTSAAVSTDDFAVVDTEISFLRPGRIKYQATYWFGKCEQNVSLPAGSYVRVLRREGNAWVVQALSC